MFSPWCLMPPPYSEEGSDNERNDGSKESDVEPSRPRSKKVRTSAEYMLMTALPRRNDRDLGAPLLRFHEHRVVRREPWVICRRQVNTGSSLFVRSPASSRPSSGINCKQAHRHTVVRTYANAGYYIRKWYGMERKEPSIRSWPL